MSEQVLSLTSDKEGRREKGCSVEVTITETDTDVSYARH